MWVAPRACGTPSVRLRPEEQVPLLCKDPEGRGRRARGGRSLRVGSSLPHPAFLSRQSRGPNKGEGIAFWPASSRLKDPAFQGGDLQRAPRSTPAPSKACCPTGAFRRAGHRTRLSLSWRAGTVCCPTGGENAGIPKPQDVGDTHRKAGRTITRSCNNFMHDSKTRFPPSISRRPSFKQRALRNEWGLVLHAGDALVAFSKTLIAAPIRCLL